VEFIGKAPRQEMMIYLRKTNAGWTVAVRDAEACWNDLPWAALSAMDLAERLGLPVELGSNVPKDALLLGARLREQLRKRVDS
jgi:hypothetical protein